jgi:farnesyl diphosphate synthase
MTNDSKMNFQTWLTTIQTRTEHTLNNLIPAESIAPQRLHAAMRYATLGGGKRVRALLAHAAGEFCQAPANKVDFAAAAIEMIHAYSLVHDDMPCMDDDDLRRGKPSCHKQFDDATALLVGDALQSLAFEVLSSPELCMNEQHQLKMLHLLAVTSGSRGMAGGQAIDLASVGKELSQTELEYMHIHKTGALIRAATLLGAYCSSTEDADQISAIEQYAQNIGLAFQVVDDILDAEADTKVLGKTAGKDANANKPTYVTLLGIVYAKELANELFTQAVAPLLSYGDEAKRLVQIAQFITERDF